MQSFFLAAQERGFYVLNDVFRYLCTARLAARSLTLARVLVDCQAGSAQLDAGRAMTPPSSLGQLQGRATMHCLVQPLLSMHTLEMGQHTPAWPLQLHNPAQQSHLFDP